MKIMFKLKRKEKIGFMVTKAHVEYEVIHIFLKIYINMYI